MASIEVNPDILASFAFYATICLFKVLMMAPLTGKQRFATKTFANPEDAAKMGKVAVNEDVERVRRAHLNDLENVIPFVLLGFLYVLTANPDPVWATRQFQVSSVFLGIFTVARIAHSVVYVMQVPQPARAICFFVGLAVCFSLAAQIIF